MTRVPVPRLAALLWCAVLAACASGVGGPTGSPASHASPHASSRPAAPSSTASRPPTNPPSTPTGPEASVSAALAGLDRRAQIAQLFLAGVPLTGLPSGDAIVRSGVGGVFLAGRSTLAAADLAATTARWQ
jgi:beta-N-acetylhexosaminidase